MKLTLFACGLVIVLLSKGALAQPCIETIVVDVPVSEVPFAPASALEHASVRRHVVSGTFDHDHAVEAMQNPVAVTDGRDAHVAVDVLSTRASSMHGDML